MLRKFDQDKVTGRRFSNAGLADSILVANGNEEKQGKISQDANNKKLVLERLEAIKSLETTSGVKDHIQQYLIGAQKQSTRNTYDRAWHAWATWCADQDPPVDPIRAKPNQVVEYLYNRKHQTKQILNVVRSAIASVQDLLPRETRLAEESVVKKILCSQET